jgi:hypothetical protein
MSSERISMLKSIAGKLPLLLLQQSRDSLHRGTSLSGTSKACWETRKQ